MNSEKNITCLEENLRIQNIVIRETSILAILGEKSAAILYLKRDILSKTFLRYYS